MECPGSQIVGVHGEFIIAGRQVEITRGAAETVATGLAAARAAQTPLQAAAIPSINHDARRRGQSKTVLDRLA